MEPGKRGRPNTFPTADLQRLLAERRDQVIHDGNIVGKKSPVWNDIAGIINARQGISRPLSAEHIYVAVTQNRYKLQDVLFEPTVHPNGSSEESTDNTVPSQSTSSETCLVSSEGSEFGELKGNLNFKIKIGRKEWNEMRPEAVTYKDKRGLGRKRTYYRLRRRTWTHIINKHFWKLTKLQCRLSYYGGRLSTSEAAHAITIHGFCTFCKSKFHAFVEKLPDEEGEMVEFVCSYSGSFSTEHPKSLKRNLAGVARQKAVKKMIQENVAPLSFQRQEGDKLMEKGDLEPAHLPSTAQLRDAKCKELRALRIDDNPIIAIAKAMYESRFRNIIRDLHYDKFLVRYHSSTQIHVYRQFCKSNKPISAAIDATGGVVKKLKRAPGVRSGHIFLYNLVVRDADTKKIYPICSLLSERQDTETIRHWLATFLRCGVSPPQEVVTDMSFALMSACVQAFTSLSSLDAYLDRCGELLKLNSGQMNPNTPECFVRNDVAHLVKMITSWKCFQGCIKITKQFYVRSLCQVVQSSDLEEVKILLTHIVTVATSETEGKDEEGNDTPSEKSKKNLIGKIGGFFQEGDDIETSIGDEDKDDADFSNVSKKKKKVKHTKNVFGQILTTIQETVSKKMVIGDRGNQQYLPGLVKHIADIAPLMPTWTSIMVPIFGFGGKTASSAPVETDFRILKKEIFQNKTLPLRVDDFLFHHIPSVEGAMKMAAANKASTPFEVLSDSSSTATPHDNSDEEMNVDQPARISQRIIESKQKEDWGGLISSQSEHKRKQSSYLEINPEFRITDFSRARPARPIGLLKNGNIDQLQPVTVDGDKCILSNTCAFDSIVQLFAVAYCDSIDFQNYLDENIDKFFSLVKQTVVSGVSRQIYVERTRLLAPLYKSRETLPGGLKKIPCEISVGALAPKILQNQTSVLEETVCCHGNCLQPVKSSKRPIVTLSLQNPTELPHLNDVLNGELKEKTTKCFQITQDGSFCPGEKVQKKQVGKFVLIEPIDLSNKEKLLQCELKVRDIPQRISINNQELYLRGCIAFLGSNNLNEIGHYVAYTLRSDTHWETYNDLNLKREAGAPRSEIKCHLMLYTV